jgi:hypothetical protein
MRFWTFALASFGLSGTLLAVLGFGDLASAAVSVPLGLGVGWAAAWFFRQLKQSNVTGDVGLRSVGGSEASVLLPVGPGKRGKVRALVDGQTVDLLAETRDGLLIGRGEKVLVVSIDDGIAQVTHVRRLPGPTADGVAEDDVTP